MKRLNQLLQNKKNNILSVYFTAGFPEIDSAKLIIQSLEISGVDLIEIGMPFSDPVADGEVIQKSSQVALKNGMSLNILFEQLRDLRTYCNLPVVLMGYFNPVLQFGVEKFLQEIKSLEIDGLILPDLPLEIYISKYKAFFNKNNISNIFLITPETSEERIGKIDSESSSFIYAVSTSSTTGKNVDFSKRLEYLERIKNYNLKHPFLVGFGVSNRRDFDTISSVASGAIIGTAFIKTLESKRNAQIKESVGCFIQSFQFVN